MRKLAAIICALAACVCLGILAACGDVAVESVTLDKTAITLTVGDEETLTVTVTPDNATDKTVFWSSSDTSVATVNGGKVTAQAEGTATITAKAGEKSATCTVTVNKANVKLTETEWDAYWDDLASAESWTIVTKSETGAYSYTAEMKYDAKNLKMYSVGYGDESYVVFDSDELTKISYSYDGEEEEWFAYGETFESLAELEEYVAEYNMLGEMAESFKEWYESLTYNESFNTYSGTVDVEDMSTEMSVVISNDKIEISMHADYSGMTATMTYEISDINSTTVTVPEEALAAEVYYDQGGIDDDNGDEYLNVADKTFLFSGYYITNISDDLSEEEIAELRANIEDFVSYFEGATIRFDSNGGFVMTTSDMQMAGTYIQENTIIILTPDLEEAEDGVFYLEGETISSEGYYYSVNNNITCHYMLIFDLVAEND